MKSIVPKSNHYDAACLWAIGIETISVTGKVAVGGTSKKNI
jgi:hypothetical protein